MIGFTALLGLGLIFLFYAPIKIVNDQGHISSLNTRVENLLFDITTRIAPNKYSSDELTLISIDNQTISTLDPEEENLSWTSLLQITKAALSTRATTVLVFLYPQIFPYDTYELENLVKLAESDRRLIIGVFNIEHDPDNNPILPEALAKIKSQVGAAEIKRYFRTQVIREMNFENNTSLRTIEEILYQRNNPTHPMPQQIKLNFFNPENIYAIKAENLLKRPSSASLDNKTVLIGYDVYRESTRDHREATYVNTPWQSDGEDISHGTSLLKVHLTALTNLFKNTYLHTAPGTVIFVHTLVISIISVFIWQFSIGFASFLFIGGWALLLVFHAGLFSIFNLYIPLSHSAVFTSLATIGGAFFRLIHEAKIRATKEAKMSAEKEIATTQDTFLNRFSFQLSKINGDIKSNLLKQPELKKGSGTLHEAYTKALGSCEEMEEYLIGIQQFAETEVEKTQITRRVAVDLPLLTNKILNQFESRIKESNIQIDFQIADNVIANTDITLTAQIIFNLISNAIKYSPQYGKVTIKFSKTKKFVKVIVKDNGHGISVKMHDKIFEKFYRIQDDLVYKVKGHGLGLYLSSYFAKLIGATIELESEIGKGCEFRLVLPIGGTHAN